MSWFGLGGPGGSPPSPQPLRSLTIPRLINTLINPFAQIDQQANLQREPYVFGDGSTIPLRGGTPMWVYAEFNLLGAFKTGRTRLPLPDSFTLLSYFASSSSNARGGFRVNIYDVNRRLRLTERPVNFNTLAGTGAAPLFQGTNIGSRKGRPYSFQDTNAQVMLTLVNLEAVANTIQFGFYGVQGAVVSR